MYILKFWVSNVDGLSKNGFVGSEETNNMSYIDNAAISHIKVVSTPLVGFLSLTSDNMESRIFLVVLIIRCQNSSHMGGMWWVGEPNCYRVK